MSENQLIYSKPVIEFATVAAETCLFLEHAEEEIKDFAANFQIGESEIMTSALVACVDAFAMHWGQKLLNALRALHSLRYSDDFGDEEPKENLDPKEYRKLDRNSFLRFQSEE